MIAARSRGARLLHPLATAIAVLVLALLPARLALASPAAAAEPANLRAQLTDDVGALSAADEREVSAAQATLLDETGIQLWAWFTDTTGSLTAPDFAAETARLSSLGGTDFLIVLAMDDRAYGYWASEAIPLSNAEIEQILSTEMEPGLREGDNAGAIVSLAEALGRALAARIGQRIRNVGVEAATPRYLDKLLDTKEIERRLDHRQHQAELPGNFACA